MSSLLMKMAGPVRVIIVGVVDRGVGKEVAHAQDEDPLGSSSCVW